MYSANMDKHYTQLKCALQKFYHSELDTNLYTNRFEWLIEVDLIRPAHTAIANS